MLPAPMVLCNFQAGDRMASAVHLALLGPFFYNLLIVR